MNSDEVFSDLRNKGFFKTAATIQTLIEVEQFILNGQWTDYLQDRIDFGNKYLLKGIQYRLIMEDA